MPATKRLTIAALLAVTVSIAGCNSKKASSTDSGTAATTAAAAPAASAAIRKQQTDMTTTIPGLGDKAAFVGFEIVVAAGGKTIDIRSDSGIGNESPKLVALAKLVIAGLH